MQKVLLAIACMALVFGIGITTVNTHVFAVSGAADAASHTTSQNGASDAASHLAGHLPPTQGR